MRFYQDFGNSATRVSKPLCHHCLMERSPPFKARSSTVRRLTDHFGKGAYPPPF